MIGHVTMSTLRNLEKVSRVRSIDITTEGKGESTKTLIVGLRSNYDMHTQEKDRINGT